jgi:hypothetical protein
MTATLTFGVCKTIVSALNLFGMICKLKVLLFHHSLWIRSWPTLHN